MSRKIFAKSKDLFLSSKAFKYKASNIFNSINMPIIFALNKEVKQKD